MLYDQLSQPIDEHLFGQSLVLLKPNIDIKIMKQAYKSTTDPLILALALTESRFSRMR